MAEKKYIAGFLVVTVNGYTLNRKNERVGSQQEVTFFKTIQEAQMFKENLPDYKKYKTEIYPYNMEDLSDSLKVKN